VIQKRARTRGVFDRPAWKRLKTSVRAGLFNQAAWRTFHDRVPGGVDAVADYYFVQIARRDRSKPCGRATEKMSTPTSGCLRSNE
jgi:hypothetical protein